MNEISRILSIAKKRMFFIDLLKTLAITLFIVGLLMVAARITQKLVPVFELPWMLVFASGACVALIAALIWSLVRRPSSLRVAQEVDDRRSSRESLDGAVRRSV